MMYQMSTSGVSLNYYSKNSLAREKKYITSLYSLICNEKGSFREAGEISIKVNQHLLGRKNQLVKKFISKEVEKDSDLEYLHESQQNQILRESHRSSLAHDRSIKSSLSKASHLNLEEWNNIPSMRSKSPNVDLSQSNRDKMQQNEEQNEQQDDSFVKSVYDEVEETPCSVVIQKIGINHISTLKKQDFFKQHPMKSSISSEAIMEISQPKEEEAAILLPTVSIKLQPPQPLEPEVEASKVASLMQYSSLAENKQVQFPDKVSIIDEQYDQKDFFDSVDSPIQLLKEDSQRQLVQSQIFSTGLVQLKEILLDVNKEINMNAGYPEKKLSPQLHSNMEKEELNVEEVPKQKKMNFKAMMSKNKQGSGEVKKDRNKKLLLNFFDQN